MLAVATVPDDDASFAPSRLVRADVSVTVADDDSKEEALRSIDAEQPMLRERRARKEKTSGFRDCPAKGCIAADFGTEY